ncbi:hypothetical protein [Ferrovum myxofaciens]|uniref:hypothetical protein n=1 Tax=Ferrovum myxofaciens TaxID=416213 RepID=UPI0023572A9E|nr:hypothetical protein [Ferrovum myxofaciens]MBU6995350.1 hypothetical protein [Ferrovum myxofaciens]
MIGHLKADHWIDLYHLKRSLGGWSARGIENGGVQHSVADADDAEVWHLPFLRLISGPMAELFGRLLGSKVGKPTLLPGFMAPQPA